MSTDTSHRGDSNQHTTPLPTSALLPSDTPITPTPEQVIKPGSQPCRSGYRPGTSPHIREGALSVWKYSSQSSGSPTGAHYLGDEAQRGQLTCPEPHSPVKTGPGFKLKSVTPGRLCPAPGPFSRLSPLGRLLGKARKRNDSADGPSSTAAPLPARVCSGAHVRFHLNRGSC